MTSKYEVTGVADLRRTRHAGYRPPTTRPPRPVPLIAAIYEAWTAEVKHARDAYDQDPQSTWRQVAK